MTKIDKIDTSDVANNCGHVVSIGEYGSIVFIDPAVFKAEGYDRLGFCLCKSSEWLASATHKDIHSATNADKILRITEKSGKKHNYKVVTAAYVVSVPFYKSKIGELNVD